MSRLKQYRMIDILSNVDISLLETEFPEIDLSNEDLLSMYSDRALTEEFGFGALEEPMEERIAHRKRSVKKRIALWSGIAAGSIAVTGVIVLVCKKYDLLKKAA